MTMNFKHETFQSFSLLLTLDAITLCDKKIEKVKRELKKQLNDNEREQIISALQKNDELNKNHFEQCKRKSLTT